MAKPGETIENPVTEERITWIETAESSRGELLACDLYLPPAAAWAAPMHRHVRQQERFAVQSGTIAFELAGETSMASRGDEVTVPIGAAHRWWKPGRDEVRARIELRPALDTETFFESFFGLARDGKTNAEGIPGLLQIAVAVRDLGDSCPQLVKPPPWVQRGAFAVLAPIGRLAGRRAVYAKYSPRHRRLAR